MVEQLWNGVQMRWTDEQFRLSTDSMVLADFCTFPPHSRICDLGCGCGSLSLLLCGKYPQAQMTGVELQPSAAAIAQENAAQPLLEGRFSVLCGDLRQYRELLPHGGFDAVVSNPPYYPVGSGIASASPLLAAARTELTCTLDDLCACASWLLTTGGRFCMVHKPERLADLFFSLRQNRLEPKRIRLVRHREGAPVALILVEARLGGRPGLLFEPDLVLFTQNGTPSKDHKRIYHQEG